MNLLDFVGMGTVMGTKDTNTDDIMVYVPALFPTGDGRTAISARTQEQTSLNARGEQITSKNLHTNGVPASWMNTESSSRITSPDVREGSQVAIYKIGGANKYYWTTQGVNKDTFRLETVIHGWSANPEITENTPFNVDNYYLMKVDTRTGLMALRTAKSNNEKSAFDIQVDGMNGVVSIGGSEKSLLVLDDYQRGLTYTNADSSILRVDKDKFFASFEDSLTLAGKKTINIVTDTLNIQAKTANIDVELTRWKGRIEHTGDTAQVGDYTQTGNYNLTGDITHTGSQTTTGTIVSMTDVVAVAISLLRHAHGGVQNGNGVTSPPVG